MPWGGNWRGWRQQELTGPGSTRVSRDPGCILSDHWPAPARCAKATHAEVAGRIQRMQDAQDQRHAFRVSSRGGGLPVHSSHVLQWERTVAEVEDKLGNPTLGIC